MKKPFCEITRRALWPGIAEQHPRAPLVRQRPFHQQSNRRLQTGGAFLAAVLAAGQSAEAHPGHDLFEHGAAHVAMSPWHWLVPVTIGIVFATVAKLVRAERARAVLRAGAAGCIVVAVAWALRG